MPFYLAWVYGKGQTFLENLHPNSLPLQMVVLETTTLFFGQFRKGNVSPWDQCVMYIGKIDIHIAKLAHTQKVLTSFHHLECHAGHRPHCAEHRRRMQRWRGRTPQVCLCHRNYWR